MLKVLCGVGLVGLAVAGCASENGGAGPGAGNGSGSGADTGEPVTEATEEIQNGFPWPPSATGVVALSGGSSGSGTMITPEWILTAGHVVDDFRVPSAITVRWGNKGDKSAQSRKAVAVYHHPKYVLGKHSEPGLPNVVDAALVRVSPPFTGAFVHSISNSPTRSYEGGFIQCLGYGRQKEDVASPGQLATANLVLTDVQTNYGEIATSPSILGPQIVLQGDSGGPCLDLVNQTIVGIISSTDKDSPKEMGWISTGSSFQTWANGIISKCSNKDPNTSEFCTPECPCTYGGTDCEESKDCGTGLSCDSNVGDAFGRDPTWDVCVLSECTSHTQGSSGYCKDGCDCGYGGGDCDGDSQCMGGLTCVDDLGAAFNMQWDYDVCVYSACTGVSLGEAEFCTTACPCGYGGGDCDTNSDCMPGYQCANNYGAAFDMSAGTDICVKPECLNRSPYTSGFCSDECPCGHGGGSCKDDADCMPGLECGTNNGAKFGQPASMDICVRK